MSERGKHKTGGRHPSSKRQAHCAQIYACVVTTIVVIVVVVTLVVVIVIVVVVVVCVDVVVSVIKMSFGGRQQVVL